MATQATPAMPIQRIQCDPQRLAAAVVAQLQLPYVSLGQPHQQQQQQAQARILDRGAFASIYLLSTSLPRIPKSLVVRVSTRPVYNPTARKQEKDKIRGYVGILLLIHGAYSGPNPYYLGIFLTPESIQADSSLSEQPARPPPSARSHRACSPMMPLRRVNSVMDGSL